MPALRSHPIPSNPIREWDGIISGMQQQELAQMRQRDANLTALAAIGPRKKRKVDSPGAANTGVEERKTPLESFLCKKGVFAVLPTGYGGHGVAAGYGFSEFHSGLRQRFHLCVNVPRARAQGELNRFTPGLLIVAVSGLCSAALIPNKSFPVSGNTRQTEPV
ncbi:hypothetical protein PO909_031806 [Leuciscus waleckii]